MKTSELEDVDEDEVTMARAENGNRPTRNAFQRRADQFTARIYALKDENEKLRAGLERALILIDRLRARKNTCQTNCR
jgi:hypothetical protein